MDGSAVDHSDSDSGESWTLLENHPTYGDDAPDFSEPVKPSPFERNHTEAHLEKDEDTDGISIISDSDPELVPCDPNCNQCSAENFSSQEQDMPCILNDPQPPHDKKTIESLCNEDDFLEDGTVKLKTYVHRRNKRLSMVLNIIMLGSVITAAGVAIGHMWGAKNECGVPIPSVNKILSNLYKLQEENAYLRNQLKELRLASIIQQQNEPDQEKVSMTQRRYKKVFEEPLNVDKPAKTLKCGYHDSHNKNKKTAGNDQIPIHEQEFLSDIGKLKRVYNQNRSWLDEHIQRRLINENNIRNKRNTKLNEGKKVFSVNQFGPALKLSKVEEHDESANDLKKEFQIPNVENNVWNLHKQGEKLPRNEKNKNSKPDIKIPVTEKSLKIVNLERQLTPENLDNLIKDSENTENFNHNKHEISSSKPLHNEKKISYADSLKSESDSEKMKNLNDSNEQPNLPIRGMRGYGHKRKLGDDSIILNSQSLSEAEIQKDDRYTGPKIKGDKRKHDRHKIHKKQKRKNKYQQWEMKGGYMKDFDEFSMTSSQVNLGNDFIINPDKKYHNNDFEVYLNKLTDSDQKKPKKGDDMKLEKKCDKGKKEVDWFDKRHTLRAEARKKLEKELFGDTSPNNAAWYFRRMNKREQCRTQKDNSTSRKLTKQKMNFKMKH